MPSDKEILENMVGRALVGEGAHATATDVFSGLDWRHAGARVEGAPHTLYQLLNHMLYWQEWAVRWLDGRKPAAPRHAAGSWPGKAGPANRKEWDGALSRFKKALKELERRARQDDLFARRSRTSRIEMLRTIGSHNSYHIGQAALMRQLLGSWPPPSGGVTW